MEDLGKTQCICFRCIPVILNIKIQPEVTSALEQYKTIWELMLLRKLKEQEASDKKHKKY
ncbi:hypothetical protein CCAN12_710014 [Capnocytophaga canimorsus]|uniref:Uncharacterized protein n=1 Tax=Capnocytophaga canimorsus TaxID=28188 RepID=A0A0B7HG71_9FLAO|nr:hypothetical protein CCAN12_710014 [Capnocytophaga canimorsus]